MALATRLLSKRAELENHAYFDFKLVGKSSMRPMFPLVQFPLEHTFWMILGLGLRRVTGKSGQSWDISTKTSLGVRNRTEEK